MVIKRPLKYVDQQGTFKAASVVIPGDLVTLSSSGIAKGGAVDDEYIGVVLYDHAYVADNGTDEYAAAALVPVHFRGIPFQAVAATPIAIGNFVKMAASGQVQVEATAGTKTLNSIGIAITAATTSGALTVMSSISFTSFSVR